MPVEEFYATKKRRGSYRSFCVPSQREYWRVGDFYQTLATMRQMPDLCNVEKLTVAVSHSSVAPVADGRTLKERFVEQAEKWERETSYMSSPLQRMMHPSYQAILGMAADSPNAKKEIISLMLRDLRDSHREWSLALSYLTQQNPINPSDYGRTSRITASWLKWGERERLLKE